MIASRPKVTRRQNSVMKTRLAKLVYIEKQFLTLEAEDKNDIHTVMQEVQPRVEKEFPVDSQQLFYFQQQVGLSDKPYGSCMWMV